jgi:hypothetical protein
VHVSTACTYVLKPNQSIYRRSVWILIETLFSEGVYKPLLYWPMCLIISHGSMLHAQFILPDSQKLKALASATSDLLLQLFEFTPSGVALGFNIWFFLLHHYYGWKHVATQSKQKYCLKSPFLRETISLY